jgi:hypothetical protein
MVSSAPPWVAQQAPPVRTMLFPPGGVPALRVYLQVLVGLPLDLDPIWDRTGQWVPLLDIWGVLPFIWVALPLITWAALLLISEARLATPWATPLTGAQVDHPAPSPKAQDSLVLEGQVVFLLDPVSPPWALVCEDLPTLVVLAVLHSTRIVSLLVRPLSPLYTNRHPSAP